MEEGKAKESDKKEREERLEENACLLLDFDRVVTSSKEINLSVQPLREVFNLLDIKKEGKITREAIKRILPLLPSVTNVS